MRRWLLGLHALFRRTRVESELDEELRGYLEEAIGQRIASGMSREAATRAARADVGSLEATKDHVRDAGWESRLGHLARDLRYAARSLRRWPGFTAVAVVTLALGIGANTAIFSVVNSLLLRRLPVEEPERLMLLSSIDADSRGWPAGWPFVIWEQVRRHADRFDGAFAWSGVGSPLRFDMADRGASDPVRGLYVSGAYFRTLGVAPIRGRLLTDADDTAGGGRHGPVAVISSNFWQRRFGGAADAVGRRLTLDGAVFTIVGVTPPGFFGAEVGRDFDVAVPMSSSSLMRGKEDWTGIGGPAFLSVMVRLAPGQSIDAATAMLRELQARVFDAALPLEPGRENPYRAEFLNDPFTLVPAATGTSEVRGMYARALMAMLGVVAVVLLIACTNIASMMLARGAARRHELRVRLALGAPPWRLASHVLAESAIIGTGGALAAVVLAMWAGPALGARLYAFGAPAVLDASLDWRVLAFSAVVTLATVLLFAWAPAISASRLPSRVPLSASGAAESRALGLSAAMRAPLVVQIALTLVLLVTAGLFIRTFERLASRPPGFESDRILVVDLDASRTAAPAADPVSYYRRLVDVVASVPGVARAAASEFTPVHFGVVRVSAIDIPGVRPEDRRPVPTYAITPGWFSVYCSPLRAGRDLTDRDTAGAPRVAVVNETLARILFAGENPIGRSVSGRFGPAGDNVRPITIVGIIGDAILGSLWDVVPPTMYVPLAQSTDWPAVPGDISLSVRSDSGSPAALTTVIAAALTDADRALSFSFRVLDDAVNATIAWERLMATLAGFFGALALLLAALGIYGCTAYAVAERQAEVGVRIALGAGRAEVVGLVLRRTLPVAAIGIGVGIASAAAVTRYVEGMLFGVTPLDPATFLLAAVVFMTIAVLAALIPARRAATMDPLAALRAE